MRRAQAEDQRLGHVEFARERQRRCPEHPWRVRLPPRQRCDDSLDNRLHDRGIDIRERTRKCPEPLAGGFIGEDLFRPFERDIGAGGNGAGAIRSEAHRGYGAPYRNHIGGNGRCAFVGGRCADGAAPENGLRRHAAHDESLPGYRRSGLAQVQDCIQRPHIAGTFGKHQGAEHLAGTEMHAHRHAPAQHLQRVRQRLKAHGEARLRGDLGGGERAAANDLLQRDAAKVGRDARAGVDALPRFPEHFEAADARLDIARPNSEYIVDRDRPLHQRPGHNRSVSGHRECAVDRQIRGRMLRARRVISCRRRSRAARCVQPP